MSDTSKSYERAIKATDAAAEQMAKVNRLFEEYAARKGVTLPGSTNKQEGKSNAR